MIALFFITVCARATESLTAEEPVMLSSPSNLKVMEGDTVLLPCKVKNIGKNILYWKKNPSTSLFSGSIAVTKDSRLALFNESLQIDRITPEYAGEYVCQVSKHPYLNVLHTLQVNVPSSVAPDPPVGKVVFRKGESATIFCNPSGIPKPHVTWTYGDEYVQGSALPRGVRQVQSSQLHFSSVDVHHAGVYQCTAENDVGNPAKATFFLNVHYAPEISIKPEWTHGDIGASVEFVCTCRSSPTSQVVWLQGDHKQGQKLDHGGRIHLRLRQPNDNVLKYTLRIQRLRRDDLGQYTCTAKNSVGHSWKTVEISGLAEPIQLRGNETGEGSFLLTWRAKSYSPILEYQLKIRKHKSGDQWTDVMIPSSTQEGQSFIYSQSYEVTGLEPGSRYEVVLYAHNTFGWNRPSETFFIGEEPPITEPVIEDTDIVPSVFPLYEADLDVTDPTYLEHNSSAETPRTVYSSLIYMIMLFFIRIHLFVS